MPEITEERYYNGAQSRVERLGLQPLWDEITKAVSGFDLRVREERNANGAAALREMIDLRINELGGWESRQTGGVDWTKCLIVNGTEVCMGVEIQMSGRSDLLVVDVAHLREEITAGNIDVGAIVVPSDGLGYYLTDRAPRFSDAIVAVERARAEDMPLAILAIHHDGPGDALPKKRTRQGRIE